MTSGLTVIFWDNENVVKLNCGDDCGIKTQNIKYFVKAGPEEEAEAGSDKTS